MKKLIIVAGAAGEIGTEFCKGVISKDIDCIAVIRNKMIELSSPLLNIVRCNLDNITEIEDSFKGVSIEDYDHIVYLHTIGVDKFDPRGYPNIRPMNTIDEDVYKTNVNSFKYLMHYLVKRINTNNQLSTKKIKLKIAMIGGVADKYAPFVIESFCEVKYIIRQYIQSQVGIHFQWLSGLSINITSTVTDSAIRVRPFANTEYWLKPEDVFIQSISNLLSDDSGYYEIDIIKKLPNFSHGYYENNKLLYEKWSKETGIF